jgi:hypothetical protein
MAMSGERLSAQHQFGGHNSPHQHGYFTGKPKTGVAVLGPRREAHNKIVKRQANRQRRRASEQAINRSVTDHR